MFRSNEILFLIGAGGSVPAGVPSSLDMIRDLEKRLHERQDWAKFRDLYCYIKGTIVQASYIEDSARLIQAPVLPDIERLAIVLSELEKHHTSLLYPFIGSWAPHLIHVTKHDFHVIGEFKEKIIGQLKEWVKPPKSYKAADYYQGLFRFQKEYQFPLRVFSLNYDRCIEENVPQGCLLELGFDKDTQQWDGKVFSTRDEDEVHIYLYKLHGSMDWQRDEQGTLRQVTFPADRPDLIFGTDYKMQYVDPYLFYAHELRRYTRDARLIVTIGYSFRDIHINGIIKQALQQREDAVLLVLYYDEPIAVANSLGAPAQVKQEKRNAKEFLQKMSVDELHKLSGITAAGSNGIPF